MVNCESLKVAIRRTRSMVQCTVVGAVFAVAYRRCGPWSVKSYNLKYLTELKPDGLKFSLKIDLMSLAIIAK